MRILIDIGGTHTRLSVSLTETNISEPLVFDTPQKFEDGLALIRSNVEKVLVKSKPDSLVAGIPGILSDKDERLINAPHLKDWIEKPLKESLQKMLGAPVYLQNDAALAGLGEAVFGAGREHKIIGYITVSTGVGGVRIVNKRIDSSTYGFEPGHQIISVSDKGLELEDLIGGVALQKRFGNKFWEKMEDKDWNILENWLVVGIHNLIVHWSPDVVIIGGKTGLDARISKESIYGKLKNVLTIFPEVPIIEKAALGESGLYGALAYNPL